MHFYIYFVAIIIILQHFHFNFILCTFFSTHLRLDRI